MTTADPGAGQQPPPGSPWGAGPPPPGPPWGAAPGAPGPAPPPPPHAPGPYPAPPPGWPPPGAPYGWGGPPPPAPYGTPPGQPPQHLAVAIVGLFFFTILGVIAVIFASQVPDRWRRGDVAGAWSASRNAQRLGIAAIVVGVAFIAVAVILVVTIGIGTRTPYVVPPEPSLSFPTFPPLPTP